MLTHAIIISLQIVAVYVIFLDGNVLAWLRIAIANVLDKIFGSRASRYIQKPLWDCLFCMASVWTIVLTWNFNWRLILLVCGINYILDLMITHYQTFTVTGEDLDEWDILDEEREIRNETKMSAV